MKKILLFMVFLSIIFSIKAQERTLSGQVTDDTGEAIPGVNVLVKGSAVGTATDLDGNYRLSIPADAETLVFSFIGLLSQEVQIGSRAVIDVEMQSDVTQLSEVVVIAYGTANRKSFTGSLGEVEAAQIEKRPLANVTGALVGTVSGVQANAGSGQPGAAPNIRIRGIGSVNNGSEPLYVVDGVPYDQSLANLNINDIQSMSVLKDAASAALYGARAANGVVMITTKTGKKGKPTLNLKILQGVTSRAIPEYERVSAKEYYPLMWEAYRNSLSISGSTDQTTANQMATNNIAGLLGYNPFDVAGNQIVNTSGELNPDANLRYNDLDWFDALSRNGSRSDYGLTYGGGTDNTDYLISVGYLKEEGYIINSDFERYTARINVNSQVLDWLKTGVNISGSYVESNQAATERLNRSNAFVNPFNFARSLGPIYPIFLHDPATGDFIRDAAGNKIYDDGETQETRPSGATPGRHIIQETKLNKDDFKRTVVSGRTYAEATLLNDFTFRANFGADLYSFYGTRFDNRIIGDGAPAGRSTKTHSTETTINMNQLLTYRKSFGRSNLEVLVGHESYVFTDNLLRGARQRIISDGNDELINFTTTNELISETDEYAVEGYLSRLNYDFDGKYFLSASFRRDGTSRFSKDARWGNFYSFGASWRLDQEPFVEGVSWVDALKLRASFGQVGNDNVTDDDDLALYYPSQNVYELDFNNAEEPGVLQGSPGNSNLEWETNTSIDIGADFSLFQGRLNGTIEYFFRESDNLLFDVPLPLSSGIPFAEFPDNIGTMSNKGIEIQIDGDLIRTSEFVWNLNINASTFKNEITKLPQEEIINGTKKLKVGRSVFDYWLRDYYGVNPADGSALYRSDNFDEDNDIIIGNDTLTTSQNNARFHYAESAIPDLYGGITNTVSYKGFTLSVLLTYQLGGHALDRGYRSLMADADFGAAMHKDALKRWRQPGDQTSVPRLDVSTNNVNVDSDRWLTSGTHLNVRQITLNYDIPTAFLQRAGVSNANVYLTGENLHLFSERKGLNVVQNFSGVTSNVYVPSRVFSVGLNVGF
ncbi:MAG: TonB-dependent receptor [Cyclobacteriaceae bacterium]|nr:TonB-dependent receptor [Cyclobacteriaceae bacterium HetDA_MAG_MS6]